MSHIWMSHVTHMNESCHTYEWVISHIYFTAHPRTTAPVRGFVWHDIFTCGSWLMYMEDMTHSYKWHSVFKFETPSFIYVTWLIYMCDMTHSYVWHDSLICMTWLINMCDMAHSTYCNTLQQTATHCNTLQNAATHCSTLQHTAAHCNTLQHAARHCNTLQHAATHCNSLQHTAIHCIAM